MKECRNLLLMMAMPASSFVRGGRRRRRRGPPLSWLLPVIQREVGVGGGVVEWWHRPLAPKGKGGRELVGGEESR